MPSGSGNATGAAAPERRRRLDRARPDERIDALEPRARDPQRRRVRPRPRTRARAPPSARRSRARHTPSGPAGRSSAPGGRQRRSGRARSRLEAGDPAAGGAVYSSACAGPQEGSLFANVAGSAHSSALGHPISRGRKRATPRNLPVELSSFVGRGLELLEIRRLLAVCAHGHADRPGRDRQEPTRAPRGSQARARRVRKLRRPRIRG